VRTASAASAAGKSTNLGLLAAAALVLPCAAAFGRRRRRAARPSGALASA
jgi:hypothetical protein